ncbi:MAG: hypothetical protein U0941_19345 [Planctomycetaceae bacterium]
MTMTPEVRWQIACHEAGHAIGSLGQGGRCCGLVIVSDGGFAAGQAGLPANKRAYSIAAGPAGEKLAKRFPVPESPHAELRVLTFSDIEDLPVFASCPGLAARMCRSSEDQKPSSSDAMELARWAITGHEEFPGTWKGMIDHAHRMAAEIIRQHEAAFLRIARALYIAGSLGEDEIISHFLGEV